MSWYAIDAVGDAFDAARAFLFPVDAGRWLRLAVVVFFLGGVGGGGGDAVTGALNSSDGNGGEPPVAAPPDVPFDLQEALPVVAAVAAVVAALALLFGLVGSVMRFVLLDALRTDEVRVRRPFRRRLGQGARLFGFTLALGLLFALPLLALGAALVLSGPNVGFAAAVGLFALGLLGALLSVPYGLIVGFTNTFVAPVMVAADCGVLAGWRRFWPTLRREWAQFLAFLVVRFLLGIAVGAAVGIVASAVAAVVGVVALSGGLLATLPFGGVEAALATPAGVAALAVLAAVGTAFVSLALLPLRIPVTTYFVAYELLVLRRANAEFDLLPWFEGGRGGDRRPPDRPTGADAPDGSDPEAPGGDGFDRRTEGRGSSIV